MFSSKATGWLYVTGGGFLLAVNETWEIAHRLKWDAPGFFGICAVLGTASFFNARFRVQRTKQVLERRSGSGSEQLADAP